MSAGIIEKPVLGNKRCHVISFSAGGAEEEISTGFNVVDHFFVGIKSVATSAYTMQENKDSSGVAANGTIGCSGMASGDEMFLYVFGH